MNYANGRLPLSTLTLVAPRRHLRTDAADAYQRLAADFAAHFGKQLGITDAYRDYAEQVAVKAAKGKYAATPGTSLHGWGIALDLATRVNIATSTEHAWMDVHASRYGWVNPRWAQDSNPSNGQFEPWHWEYVPALDQHTGGTLAARPTPAPEPLVPDVQEDDMIIIRRASDGASFLVLGGRGARLLGGGNLEALAAAEVKTANVTADQYTILSARYLEVR